MRELEDEEVSDELIEKMKESFYVEYEMAANYVEDGYVMANVNAAVMSVYGIDGDNSEEYTDDIIEGIINEYSDAESGYETIAGVRYKTAAISMNNGNADVVSKIFVRSKGTFIFMMNCVYVDGCDYVYDDIINNFENY